MINSILLSLLLSSLITKSDFLEAPKSLDYVLKLKYKIKPELIYDQELMNQAQKLVKSNEFDPSELTLNKTFLGLFLRYDSNNLSYPLAICFNNLFLKEEKCNESLSVLMENCLNCTHGVAFNLNKRQGYLIIARLVHSSHFNSIRQTEIEKKAYNDNLKRICQNYVRSKSERPKDQKFRNDTLEKIFNNLRRIQCSIKAFDGSFIQK